ARLDGCFDFIPLGNLASTLRSIQTEGSRAFYAGSLTASICQDLATAGSRISAEDLASYEAHVTEPLSTDYRGAQLYVSGNLTAGPSIIQALDELQRQWSPGGSPDADTYIAYARALRSTYEYRLNSLGEGHDGDNPGNTSHVCVADSQGNVVSLTQTIMSAFGSRVMLPGTGILMNNGMMWFDPRPGGPNAIVGGRRPLCNMCPVILKGADESVTAIGACGGRKIFPAVFQLTSFLTDFGMDVDTAVHTPRLDVSGTDQVTLMSHLEEATISRLQREFTHVVVRDNGVNPNLFALPQIIRRDRQGHASGGCFVPSPHAAVSLPASG
ncbi:MAG: gamma-glutamyltransferase, partial [Proteobacteria bacterium]|nr:gamma-glutamyltransferase [Pseudomonadota bacterium]